MPPDEHPSFENALSDAQGVLGALELAQCHGVSCGLICAGTRSDGGEFLSLLDQLQILSKSPAALREVLVRLHATTRSQLEDTQFRLVLWLPDDDEPLEDRTAALGQWCTGFLAGLGGSARSVDGLSEEATEAMTDLREIAMVTVGTGGEDEANEEAFAQLVEYIRVVALLLRAELEGPKQGDPIH